MLIPYAGYDPTENDFSDVPMAKFHENALTEYNTGRKPEIDVDRAIALHNDGKSWREVGVILAKERKRKIPFHKSSVKVAVIRVKARAKKIEAQQVRL